MNISFGQQLTPAFSLGGWNGNHWREDVWICRQFVTGRACMYELRFASAGGSVLGLEFSQYLELSHQP